MTKQVSIKNHELILFFLRVSTLWFDKFNVLEHAENVCKLSMFT